jgi:hypothetical protein
MIVLGEISRTNWTKSGQAAGNVFFGQCPASFPQPLCSNAAEISGAKHDKNKLTQDNRPTIIG